MKKFKCKEIMNGPGCDMEFIGNDMMDVLGQCGKHVAASTDAEHQPLRDKMKDMMANGKEEDKAKWFEWWKGEWDKKAEI